MKEKDIEYWENKVREADTFWIKQYKIAVNNWDKACKEVERLKKLLEKK